MGWQALQVTDFKDPITPLRIPRDGEQCFHGIVNTDSTAT
jgi:hypothetical protein